MLLAKEHKIKLLKIEIKRLECLLKDVTGKGTFEWNSALCPVCITAVSIVVEKGMDPQFRCAICNTMDISARCHSIDSAYCLREVGDIQLTDEDVEFFENLFTKYMMNVEKELDILQ